MKKGDVVYLKSGSPAMTVVIAENKITCVYFIGNEIADLKCDIECLTKENPNEKHNGINIKTIYEEDFIKRFSESFNNILESIVSDTILTNTEKSFEGYNDIKINDKVTSGELFNHEEVFQVTAITYKQFCLQSKTAISEVWIDKKLCRKVK